MTFGLLVLASTTSGTATTLSLPPSLQTKYEISSFMTSILKASEYTTDLDQSQLIAALNGLMC